MNDGEENIPPAPITTATPIKEQPEEAIIAAMVEQDVIAVTIEQDGASGKNDQPTTANKTNGTKLKTLLPFGS